MVQIILSSLSRSWKLYYSTFLIWRIHCYILSLNWHYFKKTILSWRFVNTHNFCLVLYYRVWRVLSLFEIILLDYRWYICIRSLVWATSVSLWHSNSLFEHIFPWNCSRCHRIISWHLFLLLILFHCDLFYIWIYLYSSLSNTVLTVHFIFYLRWFISLNVEI